MNAEVIVGVDQIEFTTKTNGDRIRINGIHFDAENASNLAHLINSQEQLKVEISSID